MKPAPFTHDHYRQFLSITLEAGYRFAGFDDLERARSDNRLTCFLRHDCDNDLVAALRLARIEAEHGVHSTYFVMLRSALYNLMAPGNAALIREILSLGHRLGLHYDEHAYPNQALERIPDIVDRERCWLSEEFEHPVNVVSFHQPSAGTLKGLTKINCLNTYDPSDMAGLHYVSDSNLSLPERFPTQLMKEEGHRLIHILLHPEWWTDAPAPVLGKWRMMLTNNFDLMQESLLRRENTYCEPQAIFFKNSQP